jgi:serine/threonine-protein kinase SRPK3
MGQRPLFGSWYPTEDVIFDEHIDVLGRLPEDIWTRWTDRRKHFDEQLRRVNGEKRQLLEERLEYSIQEPRKKEGMAEMSEEEKHNFLQLMRAMLAFSSEDRMSAKDVLESAWVRKWRILF